MSLNDFIQKERLLVTAIEKKVDSLLKSGLDHPCKDSCSGWGQGYERHQYDSLKKRAQLLEIVEILSEALESVSGIGVKDMEAKIQRADRPALISIIDTDTAIAKEALAKAEGVLNDKA